MRRSQIYRIFDEELDKKIDKKLDKPRKKRYVIWEKILEKHRPRQRELEERDNDIDVFRLFSLFVVLIAGAAGVRYYRLKHLQIAAAIQYLRNNPDLEKVSKQITRSYSRSQSRKKNRRSS